MNNLETFDTWKTKLTIASKPTSFIGNCEERVINSKCDKIEIMINDEED